VKASSKPKDNLSRPERRALHITNQRQPHALPADKGNVLVFLNTNYNQKIAAF
jgi:hypothetical protein